MVIFEWRNESRQKVSLGKREMRRHHMFFLLSFAAIVVVVFDVVVVAVVVFPFQMFQ